MAGTEAVARRAPSVAAAAAMLLAGPALAQAAFPDGCAAFVTLQMANCQVMSVARCGDDAEIIRSHIYDEDGLRHVEETDRDWDLRFSVSARTAGGLVVRDGPREPLSRAGLAEDGQDSFDYPIVLRDPSGGEAPGTLAGQLEDTGKTAAIDGRRLDVLRFRYRIATEDGQPPFTADLTAYQSDELGLYFNGPGRSGRGTDLQPVDESPVTFHDPGQAGFLSTVPLYNCGTDFASFDAGVLPGQRPED